jgi:predicted metal-dependent phosphotriesterase family hydrolase
MALKIRTVQGDINPEQLGPTNMHEHLIREAGTVEVLHDKDFLMDDADKAAQELADFRDHGGGGLLDAQPIGCGRNITKYRYIAEKVPEVPIIATTGFHKSEFYLPTHWVYDYSAEEMVPLLLADIYEGIEINDYNGPVVKRSEGKAGVLKCATSYQMVTSTEEKMCRAAARAQKESGLALITHTQQGTMGQAQVDIFKSEGLDLSRVVIGHIDRNPDPFMLLNLAKQGVNLEFDTPGRIKYHAESVTVACLKALLDAGHADQIVFAGDSGRRSYLKSYGGGPGYAYIMEFFIPRLRMEGISEEVIQKILVENPIRILAFDA